MALRLGCQPFFLFERFTPPAHPAPGDMLANEKGRPGSSRRPSTARIRATRDYLALERLREEASSREETEILRRANMANARNLRMGKRPVKEGRCILGTGTARSAARTSRSRALRPRGTLVGARLGPP